MFIRFILVVATIFALASVADAQVFVPMQAQNTVRTCGSFHRGGSTIRLNSDGTYVVSSIAGRSVAGLWKMAKGQHGDMLVLNGGLSPQMFLMTRNGIMQYSAFEHGAHNLSHEWVGSQTCWDSSQQMTDARPVPCVDFIGGNEYIVNAFIDENGRPVFVMPATATTEEIYLHAVWATEDGNMWVFSNGDQVHIFIENRGRLLTFSGIDIGFEAVTDHMCQQRLAN